MKQFLGTGKSVGGMVICALGAVAGYMGLDPQVVLLIESLGATLFGVGIAHKVQKVVNANE